MLRVKHAVTPRQQNMMCLTGPGGSLPNTVYKPARETKMKPATNHLSHRLCLLGVVRVPQFARLSQIVKIVRKYHVEVVQVRMNGMLQNHVVGAVRACSLPQKLVGELQAQACEECEQKPTDWVIGVLGPVTRRFCNLAKPGGAMPCYPRRFYTPPYRMPVLQPSLEPAKSKKPKK